MKIRIQNKMQRDFVLALTGNQRLVISSGLSVTCDKDEFEKLAKGNRSVQAMIDLKRLVIVEIATSPVDIAEVAESEKVTKSGDAEKPEELKDTANAKEGKAQHTVGETEVVEVEVSDIKTSKRKSK